MKPSVILFEGIVGSRAYGMNSSDSDTDKKGVCLGPVNMYLGLGNFEQWENPEADEVIYEVKKFCRLALNGNPSIIELFWLPEYTFVSHAGQFLLDHRECFLSQRLHKSFAGYAVDQIKKCRLKIANPETQAGIKAKNPYKHAAHCLRLLRMCSEAIQTGQINVDRSDIDADELKAIRNQQKPVEEVLQEAESLLVEIDQMVKKSVLPKEPNTRKVEKAVQEIIWNYLMAEHLA